MAVARLCKRSPCCILKQVTAGILVRCLEQVPDPGIKAFQATNITRALGLWSTREWVNHHAMRQKDSDKSLANFRTNADETTGTSHASVGSSGIKYRAAKTLCKHVKDNASRMMPNQLGLTLLSLAMLRPVHQPFCQPFCQHPKRIPQCGAQSARATVPLERAQVPTCAWLAGANMKESCQRAGCTHAGGRTTSMAFCHAFPLVCRARSLCMVSLIILSGLSQAARGRRCRREP